MSGDVSTSGFPEDEATTRELRRERCSQDTDRDQEDLRTDGGHSTSGSKQTCDIRGCINEPFNHGYCEECLNRMSHAALDLAGVP